MILPAIHLAVLLRVVRLVERELAPTPAPIHLVEYARGKEVAEGDHKGPYVPEFHVPQFFALTAIGDGLLGSSAFRHFAFKKPTQDGGTLATHVFPQAYTAGVLHDPVVCGFPDMVLAAKHWRGKFRPIVESHNRDWLPTKGQGSENSSRVDEILLNGTPVYWIGGGASNEAGQAMLTGRLVTRDELDSMEKYIAELMLGRQDSFRRRNREILIDTSTVKMDQGSHIEAVITRSTDAHVWYGCPYCGTFQRLLWNNVVMDETSERTARESVFIRCTNAACGAEISESDRQAMVVLENARLVMKGQSVDALGNVVGDPPDSLTWGLTWTALDSPLISLPSLAAQYWKAAEDLKAGEPAGMRRFFRDRLCQVYKDANKPIELSAAWLARRSEGSDYDAGDVPAAAEFLGCGVDVQLRWHYWWIEAYDAHMSAWLVAAGTDTILRLDGSEIPPDVEPNREERRASLERIEAICSNGFSRRGNRDERLPVLIRSIDVGFRQDDIRYFLRDHPHWNAIKGLGDDDSDEPTNRAQGERTDGPGRWYECRMQRDEYGEWPLWFVRGNLVKVAVQSGYLLSGGPRTRFLPRGLKVGSAVCRHLVAERQVERNGRKVFQKVSSNAANHFLDCAVYDLAMARAYLASKPQPPATPTATQQLLPSAGDGRSSSHRAASVARRHSRIARRRF